MLLIHTGNGKRRFNPLNCDQNMKYENLIHVKYYGIYPDTSELLKQTIRKQEKQFNR